MLKVEQKSVQRIKACDLAGVIHQVIIKQIMGITENKDIKAHGMNMVDVLIIKPTTGKTWKTITALEAILIFYYGSPF